MRESPSSRINCSIRSSMPARAMACCRPARPGESGYSVMAPWRVAFSRTAGLARARRGIGLLCYGTVAGGFLSDRWLGQAEPVNGFSNRSLIKYKLIIDDFGGWELFQELLRALRGVADRYSCDIATVASRVMLQRDGV